MVKTTLELNDGNFSSVLTISTQSRHKNHLSDDKRTPFRIYSISKEQYLNSSTGGCDYRKKGYGYDIITISNEHNKKEGCLP